MFALPKSVTWASALALLASGLLLVPTAPAQANAAGTGLVINEVYGAGGNSGALKNADYIELYNPTGAAISLNGLYLHYRSASGTYGGIAPLPSAGSVPSHSTYLVQASAVGANGTALPTPDYVASPALNLAAAGGQVILTTSSAQLPVASFVGNINGTAGVVDMVGASGSNTFETAVATVAASTTKSIARASGGVDSDSNAADFSQTDPTPTAATVVATPVAVTNPGSKSGYVGTPITPITLAATGGTAPYTWQADNLPPGLGLSGNTISGTPSTANTYNVTVTATDAATPTAGTDSKSFTFTVDAALDITPIAEIQGTGERSTFAPSSGTGQGADTLTTTGVVTGMYKDPSFANNGFDGFTIQTGGTGATPNPTGASDGLFVYYGNNAIPASIAIGDSVQVTGKISEFFGLTEINIGAGGVVELDTPLDDVTPLATTYPTTDAAREALESMLLAPTGPFTVSNAYSTNQYAEIGLAAGTMPLKQPSEFADATDDGAMQAVRDENAERAVTLDDGTGVNYLGNQTTKAQPVPYLTGADGHANPAPPRVGAGVTFNAPVVFDYRNNVWKFQPTAPVYLNGADVATFQDTRSSDLHPQDVGGDLSIATFNVLNYFNTTGEAYELAGPLQSPPLVTHCTYYTDRANPPVSTTGARIGNDQCGTKTPGVTYTSGNPNDGNGPRGAATAASLARQEAKLANTIEALNADVIGLEEVENSIKLPGETNRDDALSNIVRILNQQAGETKWAYVKSPGEALTAANIAEQDVIRSAFIYQVDTVETVGKSDILFGTTQFANAREPLAQVFKAKGAPDEDGFALIVNHFKSKGDNASPNPPAADDNANHAEVGAFNGDRKRQAARLLTFASAFAASRDVEPVFLAGDFNSYTKEEPITVLQNGGYQLIESDDEDEETYSYNGLVGSLDHILANAAAVAMKTGADIWEINANEAASFMYSRYNYNVTDFWQPELPFGTSDHNPEIVGLDVPDVVATPSKKVQVIATNDFHGRLLPDAGNAAGAAPFATAVKELEADNPNSIFVAAGDLVGASTFESFVQDDNPTIDALNEMGLEVSAAGNHEFDRGYDDLAGRIRDRAQWEYIAANLEYDDSIAPEDQLAETFTKTIDGVKIGFVGAVTEDLPALVNPTGIEGITVTDIVDAVDDAAADLKDDGAELVVLLVHEGSSSTECSSPSFTDDATTFGRIVQDTTPLVDAIISGHTHLAYNCRYPVADWVSEGRAVTKRPVVSAGQYGTNLNQLVFKLDEGTGELTAITQDVVATAGVGYAPDEDVQEIVDAAVDYAAEVGNDVLGKMTGAFKRASYQASGNPTENRGGESTLGNQVAEVQRWATDADIAFMNPGGLRADMDGIVNGGARDLTYRQAADVQPFANTLVNMTLTGAQIEKVLEEQWQRNAEGGVPSRPFLRLGVSAGLTYTYVESPVTVSVPNRAPVDTFEGEVTGMWLDGERIHPTDTFSVTANSFLGGGGDNFWELANGTQKADTGKIDLEAMVDYMAEYEEDPLPVDYSQRGVKVTFPNGAPESYGAGATVSFNVASWAMSAAGDVTDSTIEVMLDGEELGTAPVVVTQSTTPYDNIGTASVSVELPDEVADGTLRLMLVGAETGTEIPVEIQGDDGLRTVQVLATNDFHGRIPQTAANGEAGAAVLAGAVKQLRAANPDTVFAAAGDLIGASTFDSFVQRDKPTIDALNEAGLDVSAVGNHELDQGYSDLIDRVMAEYDADDNPYGGAEWQYIAANLKIKGTGDPAVPATFIQELGDLKIGFVGAVTEELPSLVSPDGIANLDVLDIVDTVNEEATKLKDVEHVDAVVLLIHEGAPGTTCAGQDTPGSTWGDIVSGVNPDVDAIVSGHTHKAYDCKFPVQDWIDDERAVTERPVVSAGQYGMYLNQLEFTFDQATSELLDIDQALLPLMGPDPDGSGPGLPPALYPVDQPTKNIVDAAVAAASGIGNTVLGKIAAPFSRAKYSNGTDNRGSSSTAGNMIAEVQRWATEQEGLGADIAFMNPGGIREDMVGSGTTYPRDLTYRQAANVQSFANSLINMKLTGAQIKAALEQQWQRTTSGTVPTRAFLRLGVSDGFTYTYKEIVDPSGTVPAGTKKGVVTGMWLNGEPIDLTEEYSVTVNSFLSPGGDNFFAFASGTEKTDWGMTDLESMVDYFEEFGSGDDAIAPQYDQRAVEVAFPAGAPESYAPGEDVEFNLAALAMTGSAAGVSDLKDAEVEILLDGESLGTAVVDNTVGSAPNNNTTTNNAGKASVSVEVPAELADGDYELTVVGETTGTEVVVPITVDDGVEEVQVLATNDFHGRIPQNAANREGGAAVLAGAVKQLREANSDTVFAAAGDLIGASTFDSFVQHDKPTIDALNEAGLDVSAVGNHELDQGYSDLIDRVMAEYDADDNPYGGAEWQYIAANLKIKGTGDPAVPATFIKEFGDIEIGFVGAVTEDLPSLVSPDGIENLDILDIVDSVNEEATKLKDEEGADAVILLIHEGSPSTTCAGQNTPGSTWGDIVSGVNADVDAIVSGHTHLAYDCKFPVQQWIDDDRAFTQRPVVSAGQYGMNLNQLNLSFDDETGDLVRIDQALLPLMGPDPDGSGPGQPPALYPADANTAQIVSDAVTAAAPIGNTVLGQIAAPFSRAKYSNGTDNRGSSSTAGNMIAEVQRWATPDWLDGGAQIAFMNPGGIREDMVGNGTTYPRDLTYRQAANVQSFANSLINMKLTGAQIRTALEQQWQRTSAGAVPTRAFLRLGVSEGFTYTYKEVNDTSASVPAGTKKGVITGMWLDGEPIDLTETYSVTVNSFLSPGGDNFFAFAGGTEKTDWGMTDLESMVDYFEEFGSGGDAIEPDYGQRAVEVAFPAGAPASYEPGDSVEFNLAALAMTGSAAGVSDLKDTEVEVWLDGESLGTATVDNTVGSAPNNNTTTNNAGKASVSVELPDDLADGDYELIVTGETTGTEVVVPISVEDAPPAPTTVPTTTSATMAPMTYGTNGSVTVTVSPSTASGSATVTEGGTTIGTGAVVNGAGTVAIDGRALEPGSHTLTVRYSGSATHDPSQTTLTVVVSKAATALSASTAPVEYGTDATVSVTATPSSAAGAITASVGGTTVGSGTLTDGAGAITIGGTALDPGTHTVTVRYAGDARHAEATTTVTLVVNEPEPSTSPSTVRASVSPRTVDVGEKASVSVTVDAGDARPTGRVVAFVNGDRVDAANLRRGSATLQVGPFNRAGTKTVVVQYLGSDEVAPSSTSVTLEVVDNSARIEIKQSPNKVKVNKTRVKLTISVRADGKALGGTVTVRIPGQPNQEVGLDHGRATVKLEPFTSVGTKVLTIVYGGSGKVSRTTVEHTIEVVRR